VTVSGATLYGTYSSGCEGWAADGVATLFALDPASGNETEAADLDDCHGEPGPIAAAPDGTLFIVNRAGPTTASIIRVNPADGATASVSKGGKLRGPSGVAVAPSGDLIVADAISGVLRISPQTGRQSTVASGGDVAGSSSVAVDSAGSIYVTVPGPSVLLRASAAGRQRFSPSAGIRVSVSCSQSCRPGYHVSLPSLGRKAVDEGLPAPLSAKRTIKIKLPAPLNRRVAQALRTRSSVTATLKLTPEDADHLALGDAVTVTVRLVR
jgi:DNA-binding beta-propeller fold protein YncE